MANTRREPGRHLTRPPRAKRVFFALWPDEGVREALHSQVQYLHASCGGRAMRRENLHLTLVFIGNVVLERLDALRSAAAAIAVTPSFELALDEVGFWRRNRIVWAAPQSVPEALRELVARLESSLAQAGFEFDRRPYAPHLTLLRDARAPEVLNGLELCWRVRDFALVESAQGARGVEYRVLERWPLA